MLCPRCEQDDVLRVVITQNNQESCFFVQNVKLRGCLRAVLEVKIFLILLLICEH